MSNMKKELEQGVILMECRIGCEMNWRIMSNMKKELEQGVILMECRIGSETK